MSFAIQAWTWAVLGQATASDPPQTQVSATQIQSVWDFLLKGGPLMIPIGLCSLIALTVVIERLMSLRRRKVLPPDFVPGLKELLESDRGGKREALEHCARHPSPLSNVFAAGIRRLGEPVEMLEQRIQESGEREVLKLRKNLRILAVIASITPLLGLLGTIFGMIRAFQTVATSGEALGKAELLATGIYEAMITTAAGLSVAIPVLIAHHWFSARIEGLVAEMDALTMNFLEDYAASQTTGGAARHRSSPTDTGQAEEESGAGDGATRSIRATVSTV